MRSAGPDPEWRSLIRNRLLHNSGWGTAPLQSVTKQSFAPLDLNLHCQSTVHSFFLEPLMDLKPTINSAGSSPLVHSYRCWISGLPRYCRPVHCEGGPRCPLYTPLRRMHLGSFFCQSSSAFPPHLPDLPSSTAYQEPKEATNTANEGSGI